MMSGTHVIKRQVLDISMTSRSEAESVQEAFSGFCNGHLDQVLNDALDMFHDGPERLSYNSLVLDIGAIDWPLSLQSLKGKIHSALVNTIQNQKPETSNGPGSATSVNTTDQFETFVFYLRTGARHWTASNQWKPGDYMEALLANPSDINKLLRRVSPGSREWVRFSQLVHSSHGDHLTSGSGIKYSFKDVENRFYKILGSISKTQRAPGQLKPYLLRAILEEHVARSNGRDIIATPGSMLAAWLIKLFQQGLGDLELFRKTKFELFCDAFDLSNAESKACRKQFEGVKPMTPGTPQEIDLRPGDANEVDIEDGFHVECAGSVILWPYLRGFFELCGMLNDGALTEEVAQKAVLVLHLLCHGQTAADETSLSFLKVMCGMEPDDFVDLGIDIPPEIQENAESLLTNVITNWPALKGTSPRGLREGFLQRDGLLSRSGDGWIVQVRKESMDILLDRLTWPISVIKLPWCTSLIHVRWQ